MIGGLVLAAGGGSRFGSPKQLAVLNGRPLIEYPVAAMAAVPAIGRIVVVLGAEADSIRSGADLDGAEVVVAPDWAEGVAASLRAGVARLAGADAVLIALADQPLIAPEAIEAVLAGALADPAPAARAAHRGAPGHPVVIKRELFAAVGDLRGDVGARELLEAHRVTIVESDRGACVNIDTPADLEAVRDGGGSLEVGG